MRLESLYLENIRSYQQESLEFPNGITLLAGDIGAGKSTILYAIEFALFGTRRADLSGDSLLRHGESEGSVTLSFHIEDVHYEVYRALKRSNGSVRQDTGYLKTDGVQEELTALELRAKIFELFGYPHELVTKSKDVMYRYTVYTPQEEMKRILTDSSSHRLDVLRSVFGIDTYKTVQENLSSLVKEIRDEQRFLQGAIEDLPELKDEAKTLLARQGELQEQLREYDENEQETKKALAQEKETYETLEKDYEAYQKLKEAKAKNHARIQELEKQQSALANEQSQLKEFLAKDLEEVADPQQRRDRLEELTQTNTSRQSAARTSIRRLQDQIKALQDDERQVTKLTNCPTCKQEVGQTHKDHLKEHAQEQIATLNDELQTHQQLLEKTQNNLAKIDKHKQALRSHQNEYQQYLQTKNKREQASERLEAIDLQQEAITEQLTELKNEEFDETTFDQEAYVQSKQSLEHARRKHQEAQLAKSKAKTQLEALQHSHESLKKKIAKRLEQRTQYERLREQEDWLKEVFSQAVSEIETTVFASIHQEFSATFTDKLFTLLDQESIFGVLDETFAPVLTQDGYDVDASTLSGGEKQSVALAYRLALVHVVSRHVENLRTNGVLILDEPTDGFSSDQLDKVRTVLRDADVKQLLIVSHEEKVQSYVDNVLYVSKQQGTSQVS